MAENQEQVVQVMQLQNLSPPEKFNFVPEGWAQWKKRFFRYLTISGHVAQEESTKVDLLIYTLGERAEQLIKQLSVSEEASFDDIILAFDTYFQPKVNKIFERFKFNSRQQEEGEKVDQLVSALHLLAEGCHYGALRDELIRDRLIVGLRDKKTSERLLLMPELSLEDAIRLAKQAEGQKEEVKVLWKEQEIGVIDRMAQEHHRGIKAQREQPDEKKQCEKCGKHHKGFPCRAANIKCYKCRKMGHFARVCRDWKRVNNIQASDDFMVDLEVCIGSEIVVRRALIDTGADIVAFPYKSLCENVKIYKSEEVVRGPDGNKLEIVGWFYVELKYQNLRYKGKAYVIKNLQIPILGRPAIRQMNLLKLGGLNSNVKEVNKNINLLENSKSNGELKVNIKEEFPDIFNDLGVFKDTFSIKLIDNPKPYVQTVPRGVSIPLLDKVKQEINRLIGLGVMVPVEDPTMYVSPIVVVPKATGGVRICGDYTQVNKNILRPVFPIPKVENTLSMLKGARIFSKIDATSGFYQIKLDEESQKLTTVLTPFGRFMYKRLPMGLNCSPEYFSMKFSNLFNDLEGVVIHVDDLLLFTKDQHSHNKLLREVLKRLSEAGITINKDKCVFNVAEVSYLGHIISSKGIALDPSRISSIKEFKTPSSKKELMQFLGLVNYVGRFIDNKTNTLEPLNELLKEENAFYWGLFQEQAFQEIKNLISRAPTLCHYDPAKQIVISADSSSYGLGAVLMQEVDGQREIVGYASRTLNKSEKNYAQIEKECLALVWAVNRFKDFVTGINVTLETDHKPLVQILQTKPLDDLTPRLLRFRLLLMRYSYSVNYVPGKRLVVADALSRSPLETTQEEEVESKVIFHLSSGEDDIKLQRIKIEQAKCAVCNLLKRYTVEGWPRKNKIPKEMLHYYQYRLNFSIENDYLLYNMRLVIPKSLHKLLLEDIHEGHLGITKCRERARQAVWWLGLSTQIKNVVENCPQCIQERSFKKETFLLEEVPKRAWQKVGMDLFKNEGKWHLVIIDYYSRYIEVFELQDLTENTIIKFCKETFARFGVPEIVGTDCGTQFKGKFLDFASKYNFKHVTSSPYYAQSNGCAEAGVKIAKSLLKKNSDLQLALLVYRNTPLESGFSPSELMFNRKIREILPMYPEILNNVKDIHESFVKLRQKDKQKTACYYNNRHNTCDLVDLQVGDRVWIINLRSYGKIVRKAKEPRSYFVEVEGVFYRRNRSQLVPAPLIDIKNTENFMASNVICPSKLNVTDRQPIVGSSSSSPVVVDNKVGREQDTSETVTEEILNDPEPGRRSNRSIKKPVWLDDYVT